MAAPVSPGRTRRQTVALALASALMPLGLQGAYADQAVRGAGATFPAPLYEAWFKAYAPTASFHYEAVGSGEGIRRFISGAVDFAGSDVVLKAEQAALVTGGALQIPVTAGMVVLAFNLHGVEGELKLSRAAYAGIFSGRITRWNDPALAATNPGLALPARDIALVTRLDASGTTAAFARNLAAVDPDWKGGAGTVVQWPRQSMQVAGNEGVAARVKMSEGSIGYVEYGFARRLGLPVAALENRAGKFVLPTLQSGQAALTLTDVSDPSRMQQSAVDPAATDAYPIVSYSWLFLYKSYKDAARANELRTFVQWGLTNGQQVARDLGYVPLSEQVVAYGQGILEGRTQ